MCAGRGVRQRTPRANRRVQVEQTRTAVGNCLADKIKSVHGPRKAAKFLFRGFGGFGRIRFGECFCIRVICAQVENAVMFSYVRVDRALVVTGG
jgi:hypothetical protein